MTVTWALMSDSSQATSREVSLSGTVVDDAPGEPARDDDARESSAQDGPRRSRRSSGDSSRPRRTWRQGGTSVRRWGWELVGWAVLALGVGVLGATVATEVIGGDIGALLSQLILWGAFAVPVVLALARARPRGLLRFRPVDLLFGLVLGGMLRVAQGWFEVRAGGTGAWPSYPGVAGSLPGGWLFDEFLTGVVIAPVLEEFFFRGLVLVAVYTAVRRMAGREVAMFASAIASTALFVIAHTLLAPLAWDAVVSLTLVGLVASLLVLLTGRLWAAVVTHVVYNGLWIAMATIGSLLAV
ncbi:CPBP family intramembrane glutamic endopeptidase [Microbacterium sp. P07]|uniref:CPBP family intramembrane glutamic endopeptidase n=1 Tax=Microbacterium sp. P07 TaxID=3366952 RepID=UPI0037465978